MKLSSQIHAPAALFRGNPGTQLSGGPVGLRAKSIYAHLKITNFLYATALGLENIREK